MSDFKVIEEEAKGGETEDPGDEVEGLHAGRDNKESSSILCHSNEAKMKMCLRMNRILRKAGKES